MENIELYLKVLINRVNCLLGAVNVSGSIIIMSCKRGAIRWIAPLCYTALYFLGGSPTVYVIEPSNIYFIYRWI